MRRHRDALAAHCRLERLGAGFGRAAPAEVDLHAGEDRLQRVAVDQSRDALHHRLGEEIRLGELGERLAGERLGAGARVERGVDQRLLQHELVQLVLVLEIALFLAELRSIERRLGDVDIAALDQLGHLAIEKGEEQRADVRAVDVRIGHDDDAVIAQFLRVVLLLADAAAERRDQRRDLDRGKELVEARALDVQDLALERQDRLELAVAALLRRAAG